MKTRTATWSPPNPFDLGLTFSKRRALRWLGHPIEGLIKKAFLIGELERAYQTVCVAHEGTDFLRKVLEQLGVEVKWRQEELNRIPRSGPVLVVANHPFGALDGMALMMILRMVRPDVKAMANYLLCRIPELQDLIIAVDPFGKRGSVQANVAPLKETVCWVKKGGLLAIFPAGEVSHLRDPRWRVVDPPWNPQVVTLIRKTKAETVPVFFQGCNSKLFRFCGKIHPRLRTAMLPREMLTRSPRVVSLRVGVPIPPETMEGFSSDEEAIMHLRLRTYLLGDSGALQPKRRPRQKPGSPRVIYPIVLRGAREDICREVEQLPPERTLVRTDQYSVIQVYAPESPWIMREIGRLREITFREAGEGTGKPLDIDRFDEHYVHLCLWDRQSREIAGAYRLGPTDSILAGKGLDGLYTHTLFKFDERFLNLMGPALEVGRSFVRIEFQRDFYPLFLLWKGIGAFVTQYPRYRILFGPVSVSARYRMESRQLIMEFLQVKNSAQHLSHLVRPRRPFRGQALTPWEVRAALAGLSGIRALSEMISTMETDRKGIPILMKHYLKLGGKFLCFSEDPDFGDVLDGLILVDLARTEKRVLEKYMGPEGTRSFLAHHHFCDMAC
jgi:putative hemolysin